MIVRTRIAPSPTGEDLHIGNLYTALINWVWARKNKGKFIVRIEDTDQTRLVPGAAEKILQTLKKFGLAADENTKKGGPYGPYRQSKRLDLYRHYAELLIKKRLAYYCFCSPERLAALRQKMRQEKKVPRYDRYCLNNVSLQEAKERVSQGQPHVIRLKVPHNREISFTDMIKGKITFQSNDLDDQILIKSDGYPTYHLAVVVDDHLMKISHVIRAEEWISSTPKHVLLYEAFGWPLPIFAHLPILRNPDHSKLSKRKNPVWASWYLTQGYLPEAVLNYLGLMGWSHPQGKEIFSLEEFIRVFDLKDVRSVGPVFDQTKLKWMNGEYIRKMTGAELEAKITNFFAGKYSQKLVKQTVPLIKERIKTLKEYDDYCRFFLERPKDYQTNLKRWKKILALMAEKLSSLTPWQASKISEIIVKIAESNKLSISKAFMILRIAITGKKITPPISESMEILGKEESLLRLKKAS